MSDTTPRTNPLLECCTPLFALVAPFRKGDHGESLPEDYRQTILAGFDELERMAFERQLTMQTVKEARYALAAYIDEVVLSSRWHGRLDWMSKPLQLEFFGEHLAGEGFFEHLAQLRQGGEPNRDILELYYVCLQLGFEGVYRLRGLEQLMALQVDLRSQIDSYREPVNPRLSPEGVPRDSLLAQARREIPYWVIGTVTAGVIFFTYLTYTMLIDGSVHDSVEQIIAYNQQINPPQDAGMSEAGQP